MQDLYNHIGLAQSLKPAAVTGAVDGTSVDLANFDAAVFVVSAGTLAGTDTPSITIKLQESDDNTTFTDISAGNLLGGALPVIDGSKDETVYKRGYIGIKRYVRAIVSAVAGTNPSLPLSVSVIRTMGRKSPIA